MEAFEYTPSAWPVIAKVNFQGKQYEFTLPKALPSGYILKVGNNAGAISVTVSCYAATPQDTLAVFYKPSGTSPCLSAYPLSGK